MDREEIISETSDLRAIHENGQRPRNNNNVYDNTSLLKTFTLCQLNTSLSLEIGKNKWGFAPQPQ
jgi:hypothetical protein